MQPGGGCMQRQVKGASGSLYDGLMTIKLCCASFHVDHCVVRT